MQDFEKLGSFYLGRTSPDSPGSHQQNLLMYDAKDLVTHAICVGMTGSGKTGLCIGLLEEAAIDGIPALIIDPKGDLANLMLTFPELLASDFRPWINENDAHNKGLTPDAFAEQQANLWKKGLADWGQDPSRIQKLRDAADVVIYTPASNAGVPLSIMKSFNCPPFEVVDDAELFRDCIATTTSSLLGLAGVDADPIRSREHILLSTIFQSAWTAGQNLDLPAIITQIQQPPFQRVGVMDVEGFFPSKDRFALAMSLNNLLASPQFSAWTQGQPLDVGAMLHTPTGKPRLAIVSIAHLGDKERMFVVALLLNQLLAWTRAQSGTTSLRAVLYMDEIAGYVPPVANPPSKQALLTLMKQARAFGVGCVLATQNPVDIDYKGLSNAGTWFIGRLQTEQDKARLLDGLQGAMAQANKAFDRASLDKLLSALPKRTFLMNNVHENGPVVFETRWCLSYLRGPLTKQQIKQLMDPVKARATTSEPAQAAASISPIAAAAASTASPNSARPVLPPDVPQYFLPARGACLASATLYYTPRVLGFATLRFTDTKAGINTEDTAALLATFGDGPVPVDFDAADATTLTSKDVEREPIAGATFAELPSIAGKAKNYADWQKRFADTLFRTRTLTLLRSESLKEVSQPNESEKDFRLRLVQSSREERDALVDKLRTKYASKIITLQERVRKSEQALEVQQAQSKSSKVNAALSFGAAILGGFLGRKAISTGTVGKAATAMRGAGRAVQESSDVARAEENVDAAKQQLAELQTQMQQEIDAITARTDPMTEQLATITLRPKKTDVRVDALVLAWVPHWQDASGSLAPAWQ
jgi:hypothetical protein